MPLNPDGGIHVEHQAEAETSVVPFAPMTIDQWPGHVTIESLSRSRPQIDEPMRASGVWLRLNRHPGDGYRLATFSDSRIVAAASTAGGDDLTVDELVAAEAVNALSDFTLPQHQLTGLIAAEPDPEFLGTLRQYARGKATTIADWPTVEWTVAGVAVPAAVWEFAGAWVGVAAIPTSEIHVIALARSSESQALSLVPAPELRPRINDDPDAVTQELDFKLRAAAGVPFARPNQDAYHRDHHAAVAALRLGLRLGHRRG
ncbi:hypothetical protein SAMN05444157_2810 [Frankineae bacterium MT45]|nr:hypothetical protein SAMN05444157_2810 [Frankineae bacterium MT45]